MLKGLSQFAEQHWIVGGTLVSLLWFFAARQSISRGRTDAAIFWQIVALIIMLFVCGWAIVEREWLGFAFAAAVLCIEALSLKRRVPPTMNSSPQT
jgi:hypothetical protein